VLACQRGHLNAVKYLVDVVHLEITDRHGIGRTPLHWSARKGQRDVCEFLLKKGADIESLDEVFEHHYIVLRWSIINKDM
jgi:ankyrin repeat protein